MVGTRKRGALKEDAAANSRAQRAAKRQKSQKMEKEVQRDKDRLVEEERLAEEEEHQKKLERKRLKEERRKKKEKNEQRKRLRSRGKYVLEVEFSPEAAAATRLSEPTPPAKKSYVRPSMGLSQQWMTMLSKLKEFKAEKGHCRVPRNYKHDMSLGNWVRTQRQNFIQQKMTNDRQAALEEVGFEFVVPLEGLLWEDAFKDLKAHHEGHGNCDIPLLYDESPQLLYWTFYQREKFRKRKLSEEHKSKLEEIGFDFNHKWPTTKAPTKSLEEVWNMQFQKLAKFKVQHGHLNVPKEYALDQKFRAWIETQRTAYRRGEMPRENIQKLEELGFEWTKKRTSRAIPSQSAGGDHRASIEHVWNSRLEEVKMFKQEFGHCNVPGTFVRDPVLGRWVGTQRTAYRRGQMSQDRIEALEALGFHWRATETPSKNTAVASSEAWNSMRQKLESFKEEHGHCNVPDIHAADPALSRWVKTQRLANRSQRLCEERKQFLDSLGFDWSIQDSDVADNQSGWDLQFEKLKTYHELYGNFDVPTNYGLDPQFGRWVQTQRVVNRRNQMQKERKEALDALGFDWRAENGASAPDLEAIWQMQFEKLKVYKMACGNCNVPNNYAPDPAFSRWVSTQRTVYRRNQMHEGRKQKLESLGFEFRLGPRGRTWEESLNLVKQHKEKHGHCVIPAKGGEDSALRSWVVTQRQKYSKGTLPAEQFQELNAIGFAWSAEEEKQALWDARFQQLSQFSQQNGHCGLPTNFPEDPELLEWISRQHSAYFAKKMPEDRVEKLVSIGFVFNYDSVSNDGDKKPAASNHRVSWVKHYEALLQFKEYHGHTNVPHNYNEDPRLGRWCNNQRKSYIKGEGPTQDRIEKLNAIGFDWTLEQRRSSFSTMSELKSPPSAAAAAAPTELGDAMAGAANETPMPPLKKPVASTNTPAISWTRGPAPSAHTTNNTHHGVQQMAVNLEVERSKLDNENRQLKRSNQKLQTANQGLSKRLAEAEAAFRKETQDLREKLQYHDEMLSTQAETLQVQGQQLAQLAHNGGGGGGGDRNHEDQILQQASTLQTQGNQLAQLAQEVQTLRQNQYTLQHQVGIQNLASFRL